MPANREKASEIKRQHSALCFDRAFPKTRVFHRHACTQLHDFHERVAALPREERDKLWDTGIAGTPVHYGFSFEVARWLARRVPGSVSIDWESMDDTSRLDELLRHILHAAEDEYFESGQVSTREWMDLARGQTPGTDFDWLLAQLHDARLRKVWAQLYDAAEVQLAWDLRGDRYSRSRNALPAKNTRTRQNGMRKRPRSAKAAIEEPLTSIRKLSTHEGSRLVDVAIASLAVRHRETYHFNYANPKEVYLADAGEGVSIAVFGLRHEHRFPLECTMGFLILSNGVPIGYGGSSVLFRQTNNGVNIFDEYRGSEAAFLWVQVMRVYHQLVGCTRFIAHPYQFGADNDEALKSGAFWFYYRLGYRPVLAEVRDLAKREMAKLCKNTSYRSDIKTLRRLTGCDMHLTLSGARASDLFEERWLETSSMLAMESLGATGAETRSKAAEQLVTQVARDLDIRSLERWPSAERRGFRRIAPIVAAAAPASWSKDDKRTMRELLRAKGGNEEARYARLLSEHGKFLKMLKKACQNAS